MRLSKILKRFSIDSAKACWELSGAAGWAVCAAMLIVGIEMVGVDPRAIDCGGSVPNWMDPKGIDPGWVVSGVSDVIKWTWIKGVGVRVDWLGLGTTVIVAVVDWLRLLWPSALDDEARWRGRISSDVTIPRSQQWVARCAYHFLLLLDRFCKGVVIRLLIGFNNSNSISGETAVVVIRIVMSIRITIIFDIDHFPTEGAKLWRLITNSRICIRG